MKASDVMTSEVITVGPDALVSDIAAILLNNRISAVPALNADGRLIGIVSEGDLIHRVEAGTEWRHTWWLDFMGDKRGKAHEFLKSHAVKAADVMTKWVITAGPDMPLDQLVLLLEKHHIRRVPIVEDGRVIGIVSRANLVRALMAPQQESEPAEVVDDPDLRIRVLRQIAMNLWIGAASVNVIARNGTVELWGGVDSDDEKRALRVAAELTPGVKRVIDRVSVGPAPHYAWM